MDTIKLRRLINQSIIDTIVHKYINGPAAEIRLGPEYNDSYCETVKGMVNIGVEPTFDCYNEGFVCNGCLTIRYCREEFSTLISFVPRGHGKLGLVYTCSTCNGTTSELVDIIPNRAKKVCQHCGTILTVIKR